MIVPKLAFVFDRRKKADKAHKGSIELRITLVKKQKFISTGITVLPHQWKGGNPFVSGYDTSGEDNRILTAIYQKAAKIIAEMVEEGCIDIDAIPRLLKPSEGAGITFLQYVMKRSEKKNVVDYTKWSYQGFYNKLSEYGKIKFFSDINEKAIRDFDEWLHAYKWTVTDRFGNEVIRTYSQATIGSYHKNLKNFIADAVVDGYLKENVYVAKGIKVDKGKTRIEEFLTEEEVAAIAKADMRLKSVTESRDLFLIQCYSGLAYVDMMTFDFSKIRDMEAGTVVHGKRHKTGIDFSFVVTDEAKKILERYEYKLPKLPNQKYNGRLKLVADAAGIEKNITSHMGRRSAGSIWLNNGIPLEVVSKCLGHGSLSTTQKAYAYIFDKTIQEAFAKSDK